MTITQFALLRSLEREGELALSRLADHLVMERTTLYRALTPLERQGWVSVSATDKRRVKTVSLTDVGRAAMEFAVPAWNAAQAEIVQSIGAAQLRALAAQLSQLAAIAGAAS